MLVKKKKKSLYIFNRCPWIITVMLHAQKFTLWLLNMCRLSTKSFLLVLRRRISAKRMTIVFITVRPSLQQIIELSKKYIFIEIGILANFFLKKWFLGLRGIIDGSLYGRVLDYPSMDFFSLAHRQNIYWICP